MLRSVSTDGRIDTGGSFGPVVRPRVIDRLASAASQRIALVVAPAGYGKSVAIRQYVETLRDESHIEFSLRSEHATLLGFLRGLADAVADVAPDARATVSSAYEQNRTAKQPGNVLAAWMYAHIKNFRGLIVVDDLHVATPDALITSFLVSLIERTGDGIHWIIGSRSLLDLPVGSWLAYGYSDLTVDEHDLAFTAEEAKLVARASRVRVGEQELSALLKMTEGWPTALAFALRSSTRSTDLRDVSAMTREMVYRYLAEQVYGSLTDEQRDFLQFTLFFEEIDVNILRHAGYDHASSTLEELRATVAFMYAIRPGVYRCHDLFREFLHQQLQVVGDQERVAIAKRAADALASAGKTAQALSLLTKIGAVDDVVNMLRVTGASLSEQGYSDVIQSSLKIVPQHLRESEPVLLLLRANTEADAGNFDRAESLYRRIIDLAKDDNYSCEAAVRLAVVLANEQRFDDIPAVLEPNLRRSVDNKLRGEVLALLAIRYAYAGRRQDAEKCIGDAETLLANIEEETTRARMLQRLGVAMVELDFAMDRALNTQLEAASLATDNRMVSLAARSFHAAAHAIGRYRQDDIAKQLWYLQQAFSMATKAGDPLVLQGALLHMLDLAARRGEADKIETIIEQLGSVSTSDSARDVYMIVPRALLMAWEGRFSEARRLLLNVATHRRLAEYDHTINVATVAFLCAVEGDRAQAEARCEQALTLIERVNVVDRPSAYRQTRLARLLCAAAEALAGRHSHAERLGRLELDERDVVLLAMRDAVKAFCHSVKDESYREETHAPFQSLESVGYGGLSRLLNKALEHWISEQVANRNKVTLTDAQVEILSALADGESTKEIAARTHRSIHTVQAHIQNVISALRCSGRVEALAIARARGLIR